MEEKELIQQFLNNPNSIIDKNTPKCIRNNLECIKLSLKNDKNSFSYVEVYKGDNKEKIDYLVEFVIENNIILKSNTNSHPGIRFNVNYLLYIISINPNYINDYYHHIDSLNNEEYELIVNALLKSNYEIPNGIASRVIRYGECKIVTDPRIVLKTIKQNIDKINIFKFNKYNNVIDYLIEIGYFNKYSISVRNMIIEFLKKEIKPSDLDNIIESRSENQWIRIRDIFSEQYNNLYDRLIIYLDGKDNLNNINIDFIPYNQMIKILDKEILDSYLKEYIKTKKENKNLTEICNKLFDLCRLYISKSKDIIIKKEQSILSSRLKYIFTLNLENKQIQKLLLFEKKQIRIREMYEEINPNLVKYLLTLHDKYDKISSNSFVNESIYSIIYNKNYIELKEPKKYKDYLLLLGLRKIINRLNNNVIDIKTRKELLNIVKNKYSNYIELVNNQYIIKNIEITDQEVLEIKEYLNKLSIYKGIEKELFKYTKSIEVEYNSKDIRNLFNKLKLEDEKFIQEKNNLHLSGCYIKKFQEIFDIIENQKFNEKEMSIIKKLLIDYNFLFISIENEMISLERDDYFVCDEYILLAEDELLNIEFIKRLIINLRRIIKLYGFEKTNTKNILEINKMLNMVELLDERDLTILGNNIINKINSNNYFTQNSLPSQRMKVALDLYKMMILKNKFTVPRIEGYYKDLKYNFVDQLDDRLITSGIDTNSCLRPLGNENDFLHYCILNKNGFIIELKDKNNKFIGRVAGIRNGNSIFFNQLRTIYDNEHSSVKGLDESYIDDIINLVKQCAKDIVDYSIRNNDTIENVFITKSMLMNYSKDNVIKDNDLLSKIKANGGPINNKTPDYEEFSKLPNLVSIKKDKTGIYSKAEMDYKIYTDVICLYSTRKNLTKEDIVFYDVDPIYIRKRNQINTTKLNINNIEKFNRIRALCNEDYIPLSDTLLDKSVIYGDDWYIIFSNNHIIESDCYYLDKEAEKEYNMVLERISIFKKGKSL